MDWRYSSEDELSALDGINEQTQNLERAVLRENEININLRDVLQKMRAEIKATEEQLSTYREDIKATLNRQRIVENSIQSTNDSSLLVEKLRCDLKKQVTLEQIRTEEQTERKIQEEIDKKRKEITEIQSKLPCEKEKTVSVKQIESVQKVGLPHTKVVPAVQSPNVTSDMDRKMTKKVPKARDLTKNLLFSPLEMTHIELPQLKQQKQLLGQQGEQEQSHLMHQQVHEQRQDDQTHILQDLQTSEQLQQQQQQQQQLQPLQEQCFWQQEEHQQDKNDPQQCQNEAPTEHVTDMQTDDEPAGEMRSSSQPLSDNSDICAHRSNINNVLIAGEPRLACQPQTIAYQTLLTVAAEPTLSTDETQMSPTATLPSLETTAITEGALLSPQQTSQLLLPESVVMPSLMTEASASTTSVEEETIAIAAPIEDSCAPPSTSQQATTTVSKVSSPASPEGAEK
ncbi:putative uncharacterized protein DDB_G0271606 [Schistocerca piceifrons]|uniref:putative uncharacterized protein DDB_G0271606 n=1 Tax=Schistocerca piceifrons TaxID=274613 RepID=UPI001F5E6065|nr:putative uncharacterized protein DDB_G0271606 [Schistocerca piceifrons]